MDEKIKGRAGNFLGKRSQNLENSGSDMLNIYAMRIHNRYPQFFQP